MRTFDLAPLYRSTVGFDRLFSMLDGFESAPGYPPYNIERTGENDYRVTVAVAGFGENELSIEAKENTLTIKGAKQAKEEQNGEVLYQGIAARAFERVFQLADHVQVKSASVENGLLHVDLVREIPEAKKPRQIPIGNGQSWATPSRRWSRPKPRPNATASIEYGSAPEFPGRFSFCGGYPIDSVGAGAARSPRDVLDLAAQSAGSGGSASGRRRTAAVARSRWRGAGRTAAAHRRAAARAASHGDAAAVPAHRRRFDRRGRVATIDSRRNDRVPSRCGTWMMRAMPREGGTRWIGTP